MLSIVRCLFPFLFIPFFLAVFYIYKDNMQKKQCEKKFQTFVVTIRGAFLTLPDFGTRFKRSVAALSKNQRSHKHKE